MAFFNEATYTKSDLMVYASMISGRVLAMLIVFLQQRRTGFFPIFHQSLVGRRDNPRDRPSRGAPQT
jgi:hypothetical protein